MGFLKIGSDPVGRFPDQFKASFQRGLELPVIVAGNGEFAPRLRDPACAGDFSPQLRPRRWYGVETRHRMGGTRLRALSREFWIGEGIAHVTAWAGRAYARQGREAPTGSG